MSGPPSIVPDAAARFFYNYLEYLRRENIPPPRWRWYVKRVEDFIKAQNGRRIKSLSTAEIGAYLEMPGREKRLKAWQYRQCVDAIRILYCDLLLTPTATAVD